MHGIRDKVQICIKFNLHKFNNCKLIGISLRSPPIVARNKRSTKETIRIWECLWDWEIRLNRIILTEKQIRQYLFSKICWQFHTFIQICSYQQQTKYIHGIFETEIELTIHETLYNVSTTKEINMHPGSNVEGTSKMDDWGEICRVYGLGKSWYVETLYKWIFVSNPMQTTPNAR